MCGRGQVEAPPSGRGFALEVEPVVGTGWDAGAGSEVEVGTEARGLGLGEGVGPRSPARSQLPGQGLRLGPGSELVGWAPGPGSAALRRTMPKKWSSPLLWTTPARPSTRSTSTLRPILVKPPPAQKNPLLDGVQRGDFQGGLAPDQCHWRMTSATGFSLPLS